MQFLPATWAIYGRGSIHRPKDAILAAGHLLAAQGAARNIAAALHAYNPSSRYVDAVLRYARWLRHEPGGLAGYYHRQVICHLTQWMGQAASRVRHQPRRAAHRAGPLTPR